MSTQLGTIELIPLENLIIDLQNPRYDPRKSQREALYTIAHDQDFKIVNLVQDILDKGLNLSDLPMVTPIENDIFAVLEGNRRIAALKLISNLSLLESLNLTHKMTKKLKEIHENYKGDIPSHISCVITTREDANNWIHLKHTGENNGVGIVMWDGIQTHRFRGNSPALQAIELVEKCDYIDQDTRDKLPKISITNIERILGTPDARKLLGVVVNNQQLVLKSPEDESLARLSMVVSDVANGHIKVTQLDTKEQRIEYAQNIAAQPLPKHPLPKSDATSTTSEATKVSHRIGPNRKYLIPSQFKISIPHTRINRIYWELQRLDVEKFINSCSVMFRVFVEMSIDEFAQKRGISLAFEIKSKAKPAIPPQSKEMSLRRKLSKVADYMEENKICNKDELRGVRSLSTNRNHVLSVDSLNAYVHNKDYNPTPSDIKSSWENIQVFMEKLWTV